MATELPHPPNEVEADHREGDVRVVPELVIHRVDVEVKGSNPASHVGHRDFETAAKEVPLVPNFLSEKTFFLQKMTRAPQE